MAWIYYFNLHSPGWQIFMFVGQLDISFYQLTLQVLCPVFSWIVCFFLQINMRSLYILDSSSYVRLKYRPPNSSSKTLSLILQETSENVHLAGVVEIIERYKNIKIKYGRLDEDLGPKMKTDMLCEPKKRLYSIKCSWFQKTSCLLCFLYMFKEKLFGKKP